MIWYVIYRLSNGEDVSYTSVLPSSLPAGVTSQQLTQAESDGIRNGTMRWDAATRTVIVRPIDPTEANRTTLEQRTAQNIQTLKTIRDNTGLSTPVRALAAVQLDVIRYLMNQTGSLD